MFQLENQLNTYKSQGDNDRFAEKMTPFLAAAKLEAATVKTMHAKMTEKWAAIQKYYAFDAKKYTMDTFFNDIKIFKGQYEVSFRASIDKLYLLNSAFIGRFLMLCFDDLIFYSNLFDSLPT